MFTKFLSLGLFLFTYLHADSMVIDPINNPVKNQINTVNQSMEGPHIVLELATNFEDMTVTEDEILLVDEDTVDLTETDTLPAIEKMPEIVKEALIEYPAEVYKQGIEGTVLVNVIVNEQGDVDSVAIVKSVHPVLDSNVVTAVRQFKFSPAIAGGEPVPVLIQYERIFELKEIVEKIEKYANFSGKLIERGTKVPIADAMVVISYPDTQAITGLDVPFSIYLDKIGNFPGQYREENRLVAITDSMGNFTFYSLPIGKIMVTSPITGYEEFKEEEMIPEKDELLVKYYIGRVSYSDYEIVVYGKAEKKEVSKRKLTLTEVKKIPGTGGDAVRVVQALPGVARPTMGIVPEIIVRGSADGDTKFLLDGIEIPFLFHYTLGAIKSVYNSDALKSVDFYPGGFGTRYGGAIAGMVEIQGREAQSDRWHGSVEASFIDGVVFVEGPINDRISLLATGRRSFMGEIIKGAVNKIPSSSTAMTVAPSYWDYTLRADFDLHKNHQAYFTLFGVFDKLELVVNEVRGGSKEIDAAKNNFKMQFAFNMGILGWDWQINDAMKNVFRYALTYGDDEYTEFGYFRIKDDYIANHLRNQLTYTLSPKLKINLGIDASLLNLDFFLQGASGKDKTILMDTIDNWLFGKVGGYLNCEWKPIEKLQIIPGLRFDYFPELDYHGANIPEFWDYKDFDNETRYPAEPSFRLHTRYEITKNHAVKGALGNYSQTPEPMGQAIHKHWGDPKLSATRAAQYVLGYEWQINDLLYVDLQGYYNRQWRVPRMPTKKEIALENAKPFVDNGKKRMKGIELMLRHDQSEHFFGWIAYSLSKSEYYDYNLGKYTLFSKDQTHNFIAVGNWHLPQNWDFGFKFQFTSGDPWTPVIGVVEKENMHEYEEIYGARNSKRLDPTIQLDLRFDKKMVFKKWIVSTYIDLLNIGYFLYKSPQFYLDNDGDPYDVKTGEENRRAVNQFSIPSIGFKVEF